MVIFIFSSLFQCPAGYYYSGTGAITCTICPAGSYCSDPTQNPVACSGSDVSDKVLNKMLFFKKIEWILFKMLFFKKKRMDSVYRNCF